jgi:hypothetical protein
MYRVKGAQAFEVCDIYTSSERQQAGFYFDATAA